MLILQRCKGRFLSDSFSALFSIPSDRGNWRKKIIFFSVLSDDVNDVCNVDGDADHDAKEEEGDVNDFDDVDAHASFPSSLIYSSKDKEF